MRTSTFIKNLYVVAGVSIISLAALACGGNGASNNDQGIAVTFLGLFTSPTLSTGSQGGGTGGGQTSGQGGCGRFPEVFLGGFIQLGDATPEPATDPSQTVANGIDAAGGFVSVVGIQNNLYGEIFRADRVLLEYYIPGASVQPPSTNAPISLIAGPAESAGSTSTTSGTGSTTGGSGSTTSTDIRKPIATSLPPALANLCNRALSRVVIIPPAIREWLNFNRDSLPEAPFKLEVTIRVTGLTSGGNRLETNDETFDFDVLPESLVPPTAGTPDAVETPVTAAAVSEVDAETQAMDYETAAEQDVLEAQD